MDYLQTLFGFFNAPLFATFILGMFWKRMTPTAGWVGLVAGTASAVTVWAANEWGPLDLPGRARRSSPPPRPSWSTWSSASSSPW